MKASKKMYWMIFVKLSMNFKLLMMEVLNRKINNFKKLIGIL